MYIQKSRYVLFLCTSICPEYFSSINFLKLQGETRTEKEKRKYKDQMHSVSLPRPVLIFYLSNLILGYLSNYYSLSVRF